MDNTDETFRWPDSPPYPTSDWFQLTGTELGLEPDQIRFAAALINLGGRDSRNNTIAARTAGVELSRTQAFRLARSVKVRKLIDHAEQIKAGKRKPLTEEQIDERVDKMCMSPNDRDAATGIKLRDERRAARVQASSQEETLEQNLAAIISAVPESGVGAFLAMSGFHSAAGNIVNFPFLKQCAPVVAKTYPKEWAEWRAKESGPGQQWGAFLDQIAAGPVLEGDELTHAVKRKLPIRGRIKPSEPADAA